MGTDISGIAKGILQVRAEMKSSLSSSGDEKEVSFSFMQMMSQNQYSSKYSSNVNASSGISQIGAPAESKEWAKEAYGSYAASSKPVTLKEATPVDMEETLQKASETLEAYEEGISQALQEELGVSEEEITDAMEKLGLCFLDLKNPQDLAALVQELTGEEIGTLFLSDSFQNIMEQVADLMEELRVELDIPKEEWGAFCEAWEQMEREDVPAMETVNEPQVIPEVQDASEPQAKSDFDLEAEPVVNDVPAEQTEEVITVSMEEGRTDGTGAGEQETQEVMAQPVTAQGEDSEPKQEAVSETDLEQERVKEAEQVLSEPKQKEAEAETHSDTKSGGQSLFEHSKETKTQDAGQGAVITGQQPLNQEEFAVPVQGQQNYSSQIDTYNLIEQIARNVRVTISSSFSSMEMQLNPEHLGKIYLNISEHEGTVRAQIAAQNEAVKEALETQVAELRQSLNQQGIKVDAIEVTVATHEFEQNLEQNARQEEQMGQRQEEAQRQARRNLNLSELDGLTGLMSEEEELAARIMKDNGNQVDLTA